MKFEINKYAKFGAALAGSALLFSCDGDDGAVGPPGADGNRDLTNADLTNTAFIAANLRMTLDPTTDFAYPGTPEVFFDFSSDLLAFYNSGAGDAEGLLIDQFTTFGPGAGALFQVRIVNLNAPANGTFTIDEIVGDTNGNGSVTLTGPGRDVAAFTDSDFTVTQIFQNTYLGTFTTLVGLVETPVTLSQNAGAVMDGNNINPPVTGPNGAATVYTLIDTQQQVAGGLPVIVQTNDALRLNAYTLQADEVAVRFREAGGTPDTDVVFIVNSPAGLLADTGGPQIIDFAGFTFNYDPATVIENGVFIGSGVPQRVIVQSDPVFATGQFRLEIDSTRGGDASGLFLN